MACGVMQSKEDEYPGHVSSKLNPLPVLIRFYVYGIQGFCYEIIFTAFYDFVMSGSFHFKGHSAISSFFMYGTCSLFVEQLYIWLYLKHNLQWYIRIPVYLVIVYTWEFTWGMLLRRFDACPWDYSHYRYNIKGVITLEYAPGWMFLCWVQDILADYLLRLRVGNMADFSIIFNNGINKFD